MIAERFKPNGTRTDSLYIVSDTLGEPVPRRTSLTELSNLRRSNQATPPAAAFVFDFDQRDQIIRALFPIGQPRHLTIDQARAALRRRLEEH